MHWIAFGDIHEDTNMLRRIPNLHKADGILLSGDLTNMGSAHKASQVIKHIQEYNTKIYALIGNMDTKEVAAYLEKQDMDLHLKCRELQSKSAELKVAVIGVGFSTPTPFNTPSEVSEQQLGQWLEHVWQYTKAYTHVVLVVHTPPLNTALDRLANGTHVGSKAVRNFIEQKQPDLCLTGHIHEAKGVDTLGATRIINTGMLAEGGYASIYLKNGVLQASLEQVG